MIPSDILLNIIRQQASQPVYPAIQALADQIRATHTNTAAILFYGSCLRAGDDRGGMVDLYVLVDQYRTAYPSKTVALLNRLLPPNVFYLEVPHDGRQVRAKYAVLSLEDFERGSSVQWFHSYLWGRFSQPVAFAYSRSEAVTDRVVHSLARSVLTLIRRAIPCTKSPFPARELWFKGLSLSYRAELRTEKPDKLAGLIRRFPDYYETVTRAAMPAIPFQVSVKSAGHPVIYDARISRRTRFTSRQTWRIRFIQGKMLSVMRLLKAAFTFAGGIDYIQWKIERHTGVRVELSPRLRRRPVLAACILAIRLYRRDGFR